MSYLPAVARRGGRAARPIGRAALPPAVFLIPGVLLATGTLLPVAYLFLRALGAEDFLGLLLRTRTLHVLLNTAGLAAAVTLASAAISIPVTWLTVRTNLPARRLWSVLLVLPLAVPSYVGGFAVIGALGPRGLVQQLLGPLGVERLPEIYGFFGAWLTLTLFTYPFMVLTLRGAVLGLNPAFEEAARSLGHSARSTFLRVVLPRLVPALAAGSLLVALYTFSDFGAVSLLQYDTFSRAIYVQYKGSFDRNMAAVLALVVVCLTAVILLAEDRLRRRGGQAQAQGAAAVQTRSPLGRWRLPALVFCGVVVLLGVGMPVGVTGYWLISGLLQGESLAPVVAPLLNSLKASALAALFATAAAVPVAVMSVRYPGTISALIERAGYAGYALPPIATAFALVFFAANYLPWVYQTLAVLIFAYVIRFVPQAVGAVRPRLQQIGPNLEDAARSLGRTPWRVAWSVTIPLIRPGLAAGAALVFLTTMKELPATLLLSPIGFTTLATQTWAATTEAFFTRAAASALILLLFSSLSLFVLLYVEEKRKRG